MLGSISINQVLGKSNIIDIRNIEKYNNGHIDGAINIPMDKLLINADKYLKRQELYYLYCQRGVQSKKTCMILKNKGFNVVNIEGGYESWVLEQN